MNKVLKQTTLIMVGILLLVVVLLGALIGCEKFKHSRLAGSRCASRMCWISSIIEQQHLSGIPISRESMNMGSYDSIFERIGYPPLRVDENGLVTNLDVIGKRHEKCRYRIVLATNYCQVICLYHNCTE